MTSLCNLEVVSTLTLRIRDNLMPFKNWILKRIYHTDKHNTTIRMSDTDEDNSTLEEPPFAYLLGIVQLWADHPRLSLQNWVISFTTATLGYNSSFSRLWKRVSAITSFSFLSSMASHCLNHSRNTQSSGVWNVMVMWLQWIFDNICLLILLLFKEMYFGNDCVGGISVRYGYKATVSVVMVWWHTSLSIPG